MTLSLSKNLNFKSALKKRISNSLYGHTIGPPFIPVFGPLCVYSSWNVLTITSVWSRCTYNSISVVLMKNASTKVRIWALCSAKTLKHDLGIVIMFCLTHHVDVRIFTSTSNTLRWKVVHIRGLFDGRNFLHTCTQTYYTHCILNDIESCINL